MEAGPRSSPTTSSRPAARAARGSRSAPTSSARAPAVSRASAEQPSSFSGTLNATSLPYVQGGPRYLAGTTLFRAFIYAAGGFPNDAGGNPTNSIERIIY